MERWFEFMGNHPILFAIMGILTFMLLTVDNKRSGKKISPNQLGTLFNQQNAQIIDIRPKKKFETGHIQGSRNLPFSELKEHLDNLKAIEAPIVIVCDMGMQAGVAIQMIGKENVFRLDGGISGWQAAGMPLVGTTSQQTKSTKKTAKNA